MKVDHLQNENTELQKLFQEKSNINEDIRQEVSRLSSENSVCFSILSQVTRLNVGVIRFCSRYITFVYYIHTISMFPLYVSYYFRLEVYEITQITKQSIFIKTAGHVLVDFVATNQIIVTKG